MVHKHFLSEIWHGKVTMISHCYNSILIDNFIILYMYFGKELGGKKEVTSPCCRPQENV